MKVLLKLLFGLLGAGGGYFIAGQMLGANAPISVTAALGGALVMYAKVADFAVDAIEALIKEFRGE